MLLPSDGSSQEITFRRIVQPQPTGRVKVVLEVIQGGRRVGRISQVRVGGVAGWQFRSLAGRRGEVWRTAEECKEEARRGVAGAVRQSVKSEAKS